MMSKQVNRPGMYAVFVIGRATSDTALLQVFPESAINELAQPSKRQIRVSSSCLSIHPIATTHGTAVVRKRPLGERNTQQTRLWKPFISIHVRARVNRMDPAVKRPRRKQLQKPRGHAW